MTREECVEFTTVRRVNSLVIDRLDSVSAVIETERYMASSSHMSGVCLTDTQLNARVVMALPLSANGHHSGGHCKERQVRMLIRHPSSPRCGARLGRLMDVRT
jgi:hypothetical protein